MESDKRIAVFTALDGTLLDSDTFEAGESRAAIRRLQAMDIPVIPVTVMTLEEIAPVAADLGLRTAMIIEAGEAIARWKDGGWSVERCGPPPVTYLDAVAEIEDRSGASLLVYTAFEETAAPFLIESGDLDSIERAAADIGFSVRRGRRFYHLYRQGDEEEAFLRLREELRCDVAIAAGGSLADAEFLMHADVAILIPGPEGWAAAVDAAVRITTPSGDSAGAGSGRPARRRVGIGGVDGRGENEQREREEPRAHRSSEFHSAMRSAALSASPRRTPR